MCRALSRICNFAEPYLDRKDERRLVLLFSLVRRIADNAKTNFSTEQSAAREDSRISGQDGNQERPSGSQTPPREGPQTPDTGALLIKSPSSLQKLRNSSEYRQVYSSGSRYNGNLMTVFLCPNGLDQHRLGITASRKLSVRAVKRNRAKRLLRESFRLLESELNVFGKSYDWVFNAKRSLLEVKVADSLAEMKRILNRVAEDEN